MQQTAPTIFEWGSRFPQPRPSVTVPGPLNRKPRRVAQFISTPKLTINRFREAHPQSTKQKQVRSALRVVDALGERHALLRLGSIAPGPRSRALGWIEFISVVPLISSLTHSCARSSRDLRVSGLEVPSASFRQSQAACRYCSAVPTGRFLRCNPTLPLARGTYGRLLSFPTRSKIGFAERLTPKSYPSTSTQFGSDRFFCRAPDISRERAEGGNGYPPDRRPSFRGMRHAGGPRSREEKTCW